MCLLSDVAQIAPPDWGRLAVVAVAVVAVAVVVVVVATIQSFRIKDAGQRNVYSFSASFEPHFKGAQALTAGVTSQCLQGLPDALEAEALKDEAAGHGYVRPIVLLQAQNTGNEMPPEALRRHLIDELKLPESAWRQKAGAGARTGSAAQRAGGRATGTSRARCLAG